MDKRILGFVGLFFLLGCSKEMVPSCQADFADITYPVMAHSHNDYEQEHPLETALNHGFTSIEVDIFFDGKRLVVSHDDKDLEGKLDLEEAYFKPLFKNDISERGLIILIDIKNYSHELLDQLNLVIQKYQSHLVSRNDAINTTRKVQLILSGDIPRPEILKDEKNEFLFIDGRLNDHDLNTSESIVPMISMDITDVSNSNANDKKQLIEVIELVQSKNKMIRFWNTNDKESVWLTLIELNVDVIGVDKIEKFCDSMKKNDLIK